MWGALWSVATAPMVGTYRWLTGRESGRRGWVTGERPHARAHIDVRGVHLADAPTIARRVERRLARLPGVNWAEVNAALGQVVVGHDPGVVSLAELVAAVKDAEPADGARSDAAAALPTNPEHLRTQLIAVGANLTGLGYTAMASLLRLPRLPATVPTLVTLVDSTPWCRTLLRSRLGREAVELATALGGAISNALAQRSFPLLLDACYRYCLMREVQATRRGLQRWGDKLAGIRGSHRSAPVTTDQRPVPLPRGPVERAADLIAASGVATTVGMVVSGRGAARAEGLLVAGVPRAGHLGREVFAAQLAYQLAQRGVAVLDITAMRRLDRVDTVVLDAALLRTGQWTVADLAPVTPNGKVTNDTATDDDVADLSGHAYTLIDPNDPTATRTADSWAIAPISDPAAVPRTLRPRFASLAADGGHLLRLTRSGRTVAIVGVAAELDPHAEALVAAATAAGTVVLGIGEPSDEHLAKRLSISQVVPAGRRLAASVRRLQRDGHGVVVVSATGRAGLAAADVGIGVVGRGAPPWGADLVCAPGEAAVLLRVVPEARLVSQRCARLAAAGAIGGAALAAWGPAQGSQTRATVPVATAAVFAFGMALWSASRIGRQPVPPAAPRAPWHVMPAPAVLRRLGSSLRGLTSAEAARRNTERETEAPTGLLHAAMAELANPLTPVLAGGAAVSAGVGAVVDALMIGVVMGINALLGGVQQLRADRALRSLLNSSAPRVRARRAGRPVTTPTDTLVPGDVVELVAGDSVPADCRLLSASDLEVDESSLTGESQLVSKSPAPRLAPAVADRTCMLYQGTVVAAGRATGVVVATGTDTEMRRVAAVGGDTPRSVGGVAARLRKLATVTVPLSLAAGGVLMLADLLRGRSVAQSWGRAVSLAVAAVPEGLPFVALAAETAAARRLSRRGALVRNPRTIEALGRADVLCFDKTGTLTEGRIALRAVSDGVTCHDLGHPLTARYRRVLCAALRASPQPRSGEQLPHPTDRAVVAGAQRVGVTPTDDRSRWRRVDDLPFEPSRGYHAVLGHCADGPLLSVKGAPEVVLAACTHWHAENGPTPLHDAARKRLAAEVDRLARRGYRVLAIAERHASGRRDLDESQIRDLHLIGLLGLADPVRPTAAAAVSELRRAGVGVVMITGDHPSTAEAIATELGALADGRVMTGPELDALDADDLADALTDVTVFARVTPTQKARIVRALQDAGRVVAVTGDGANDAQAIRIADVGIALGEGAVPAARDAADLVVTDDRIETIVDAIVEGRGMWVSVRDALAILLGGNLGEIAFSLAVGLLPTRAAGGAAFNARQLLLVNLLTDALPAIAVAVRPPPRVTAQRLLAEGPEASLGTALTRDIAVRGGVTAGGALTAWLLCRVSGTARHASTVALVALVGTQLGQTIVMRGRTRLVLGCGLASMAVMAGIIQTPGISHFFGCRPLWPHHWVVALGSATVFAVAPASAAAIAAWTRRVVPRPGDRT